MAGFLSLSPVSKQPAWTSENCIDTGDEEGQNLAWSPCSDTTNTGDQLLLVWFVAEKAWLCTRDDVVCSCTGKPLPMTSTNALLAVLNLLTDRCRKMWSLNQVVWYEPLTHRRLMTEGGNHPKLTVWTQGRVPYDVPRLKCVNWDLQPWDLKQLAAV